MSKIIDISKDTSCWFKNNKLYVLNKDHELSFPLEDIKVLIIDNLHITLSSYLLSKLSEFNIPVIFTNEKHIPNGILYSLNDNVISTKIIKSQIRSSNSDILWRLIIKEKISNQHKVLNKLDIKNNLNYIFHEVLDGDKSNTESKAANVYWKNIPCEHFRRSDDSLELNHYLNYGYSILRAIICRCIIAHGLIPSLGLFHRNIYNNFCLADDLMEPLRPFIDIKAISIYKNKTTNFKKDMLNIINDKYLFNNKTYDLFGACDKYVSSYVNTIENDSDILEFPKYVG